ncbi:hypothetical protein SCLCIDRAFT_67297, partial [Scleroderma citrinum Foug A]
AVCTALCVGKSTLNHYYECMDLSKVYQIAMVLHPRHKLQYFKTMNWEEDWIEMAKEIVHAEYRQTY